ncbi:MAG: hypothetical protein JWM95_1348 [Gemmatimonadetes bacterium]|nr:hypothetical protein [Gemmatimonadota bacterium]
MPSDLLAQWDVSEAQRLLDHAAVRLLRGTNASLTLAFLHRAFKEHHTIAVPESSLRARLENFLDESRQARPEAYPRSAAEYLQDWCGSDQVLLKKLFSDEADEPVFELTAATERALVWLEELQARPFVGAESRLELIVRQLEEIVLFSTSSVEERVRALESQRVALQAQIDSIALTNSVPMYSAVQLSERFAIALDLARALSSDFRQLENNFKEVARSLAEEQSRPGTTKGRIVAQLLDTHAALKESPQGQSFYAFWNMLLSPRQQEHWRTLTRQAYSIDLIDSELRANRLLDRLSSRLLDEGERVVRSNERMAATLRRALESAESGEDRRLRDLIREIQKLVLARYDEASSDAMFVDLSGPPGVFDAFNNRFWHPPVIGQFESTAAFGENTLDLAAIERFRALADLNLARLRENLRECLLRSDSIMLSEVLRTHPPREGIIEVVGYLVIAMQDPQHYVPGDQWTEVEIGIETELGSWRIPEALFARGNSQS